MPLDRESLLKAASALPWSDVQVPELGDGATVRLRVMTGTERDRWDEFLSKRKDGSMAGIRAALVTTCAIDEAGNRLFVDADRDLIGAANGAVIDRLYQEAWKLNKFGGADVEEIAKN
jgi:hypothetical protein